MRGIGRRWVAWGRAAVLAAGFFSGHVSPSRANTADTPPSGTELAATQPASLRPVPPAAAQAEALKSLKAIFKPYPPSRPQDKIELARKLAAQAPDNAADESAEFTMFREAAELAASGGDFNLAMTAIDSCANVFAIHPTSEKLALLKRARGEPLAPGSARAAAHSAESLAWESLAGGDYDAASQAATIAWAFVREAGESKLAARIQSLAAEARRGQREMERAKSAEAKLKGHPGDAGAQYVLGQYLCFWRGEWAQGLPMLAAGSDTGLKSIARLDVGEPKGPAEQSAVAQKWEAQAARETGVPASRIRARAAYWYERAMSASSGLQKQLIKSRLAAIDQAEARDTLGIGRAAALTRRLNDPSHWIAKSGTWKNTEGRLHGEGDSEIYFDTALPPDIVLSFNVNVVKGMRPRLGFEGTGLTWGNEGYQHTWAAFGVTVTSGGAVPYTNDTPAHLRFKFSGSRFEVEYNQRVVTTGTCTAAKAINLHFRGGDGYSPGTLELWDFRIESISSDAPGELGFGSP